MQVKALENFTFYNDDPIQVYKGQIFDMDEDAAEFYISEGKAEAFEDGGGDSDVGSSLVVNIEYTGSGEGDYVDEYGWSHVSYNNLTADTSYYDIVDALADGKTVCCKYNDNIFNLVSTGNNSVIFTNVIMLEGSANAACDGVITYHKIQITQGMVGDSVTLMFGQFKLYKVEWD